MDEKPLRGLAPKNPAGLEALWLWNNPNRPRGKPILFAAISAAAHCPSVEGLCLRSTGPATGDRWQPDPNADAVSKEAPWFYTVSISGSGARNIDNPSTSASGLDVPAPCKETWGYLGGNALGDSFVSFSSLRKRPQRSDPARLAGLHQGKENRSIAAWPLWVRPLFL